MVSGRTVKLKATLCLPHQSEENENTKYFISARVELTARRMYSQTFVPLRHDWPHFIHFMLVKKLILFGRLISDVILDFFSNKMFYESYEILKKIKYQSHSYFISQT